MTDRIENLKRDNRTTPERQAARLLDVALGKPMTEVRVTFGRHHRYAQIFATSDGRALIIVADDNQISAAVFPKFDWEEHIDNDVRNYEAIAYAANLMTIDFK